MSPHSTRQVTRRWRSSLAMLALVAELGLSGCQPTAPERWSGYAESEDVWLSAGAAGPLTALRVQVGEAVQAGQVLFEIDPAPAQANLDEAQARWQAARAQAEDAQRPRRPPEVRMAQAERDQARSAWQMAQDEAQRQRALAAQGFVAHARADEAQRLSEQAAERWRMTQAALDLAGLPARDDQRLAAQHNAQAAGHALQAARWQRNLRAVSAPLAGRVRDVYFRSGEWVNLGQPVVALWPSGRSKAVFYVPESDWPSLQPGQRVLLNCQGCPSPIAAHITHLAHAPEFAPPVIYTAEQRSRLRYRVEALVSGPQAELLHPGQPLDVRRP